MTTLRTTVFLAAALALVTLGSPAQGGSSLKIKGKGITSDLSFQFRFTNQTGGAGQVRFEGSFGTLTGIIDCLDHDGGTLAMMSGVFDEPIGGLVYFLLVAEDGKPTRTADEFAVVMGNTSYNCALDGPDADVVDDLDPVERGNVVVKIPPL